MRCPSCRVENRPGIKFCETCGTILPIDELSQPITQQGTQCSNCGQINRHGIQYCENCGQEFPTSTASSSISLICPKCNNENRQGIRFCEQCGFEFNANELTSKTKGKQNKKVMSLKQKLIRIGSVFAVLIFLLLFIGILTDRPGPDPLFSMNEIPLVMIQGETAEDGSLVIDPVSFSVNASSIEGIQRVETYSDGILIDAQNINPNSNNQTIDYSPAVTKLPAGDHEVFVRVYDTSGASNQSSVIPITIDSGQTAETGGLELQIDPPVDSFPSSPVIHTSISSDSREIIVDWSIEDSSVSGIEIYVRNPRTNGVIKIAELDKNATSYNIPVDRYGDWEVMVSVKDKNGNEGPLAYQKVAVKAPVSSINGMGTNNVISFASVAIGSYDSTIDRLFAYVRLGGSSNRFQRVPENSNDFLVSVSPGVFTTQVQGFDWSIKKPLSVEADLWGWSGNKLVHLGSLNKTLSTAEMQKGIIDISNSQVTGRIQLQTKLIGIGSGDTDSSTIAPTLKKNIPPPYQLHYAITPSDCELVASELGKTYDVLRKACRMTLQLNFRNFLIWKWPARGNQYAGVTEADLVGFEMKYVTTSPSNKILGENITSIANPTARAAVRSISEMRQVVPCGVRKTWYLRAVGRYSVSEWVYAGSFAP
ncbi:MAG: hypothetical protein C0410_15430, partial [Anaerolinea sp.]|nr:hypothetical protein [Anaerolinea sp.]